MPTTFEHPYRGLTGGKWYRGNLHTHTTASDGTRPIQTVIDEYAAHGHDFLMISDHDIFTGAAQYRKLNARGLVLIPGNEISRNGPHMLHVDARRHVPPLAQRQQTIYNANKAGGFVVVNHPNWQERFDHCSIVKLEEWIDYVGIEIYNGVISRLHGSPYATNKWDMLLAGGRRVWGFANDDSHRDGDSNLGWNVVYARRKSKAAIVDAMREGRFYSSTGVVISGIAVKGSKIRIETQNASRIVALRDVGKRFATTDANVIEVEAPEGAKYVRFECWGDGEKFAWTQPFFVKTK